MGNGKCLDCSEQFIAEIAEIKKINKRYHFLLAEMVNRYMSGWDGITRDKLMQAARRLIEKSSVK